MGWVALPGTSKERPCFAPNRPRLNNGDWNEAAGAADAARGAKGRRSAAMRSSVGSQGGICDPITQSHAGGTPAT